MQTTPLPAQRGRTDKCRFSTITNDVLLTYWKFTEQWATYLWPNGLPRNKWALDLTEDATREVSPESWNVAAVRVSEPVMRMPSDLHWQHGNPEAAVPCFTCCGGLADSEWHHAGRLDVDGTREVCRVNGDVKRRVTEAHRSGSSTWQRDCAAGEMMGLHYSGSRLLPLLTKAAVIKVEKTPAWPCEVAESACPLSSAHGPDLRRLKWFASSRRGRGAEEGWGGAVSILALWAMFKRTASEQFKKSLKGMFWNFTAKGSLLSLSPY